MVDISRYPLLPTILLHGGPASGALHFFWGVLHLVWFLSVVLICQKRCAFSFDVCDTKRNSDPPNRLSLHQYTCACISLALWEQEKCGSELGRCQGPAVWESTRLPCCRYSCAATVERFAIQPHCVRDTRLLQAPAEDTTFCYFTQLTELRCTVIMSPPLIGGAFSDAFVWCLTVAYIGPKSRTERHRKTKIGTEVAHVTRDSDTTFEVKRSRSPGRFTQCGLNE